MSNAKTSMEIRLELNCLGLGLDETKYNRFTSKLWIPKEDVEKLRDKVKDDRYCRADIIKELDSILGGK